MTASKRHSARKAQHTKSLVSRQKRVTKRTTRQNLKHSTTQGRPQKRIIEQPLDDDGDLYIVLSDDGEESGVDKKPSVKEPAKQTQTRQIKLPASTGPLEKNCLERHPVPEGYVFVPKGDVYVTRHCRSQTKESGRTVYVVYANVGKRTLGIRVPQDIYHTVVRSAMETARSRADAVRQRDEKDKSRARALIRALFPAIPATDLRAVVNHAFLKGSGRVGRTKKLTDERKAKLAVEAHIRHTHTRYEELLKAGLDRQEAREALWEGVEIIKRDWGWKDPRPCVCPPFGAESGRVRGS